MVSRVLILTDDTSNANSKEDSLNNLGDGSLTTELVPEISAALAHLGSSSIDDVVVDFAVTHRQGMAIFDKLFTLARETPIIIVSESEEESLTIEAVQGNAQGCPPKSRFQRSLLIRSLNHVSPPQNFAETPFIEKIRAETTLNAISDAVITTDIRGNVDYLNEAAIKMTGWQKDDAIGRSITEVMQVINGTTRKPDQHPVKLVLQMDEPMGLRPGSILLCRDGSEVVIEDSASPIHNSYGQLCGVVVVFHDISVSKEMTEKMAHLAQHDFLTDLPNRLLLQDRISQAIELANRRGTTLAVLFLDLDKLKTINDSLGHDIGDKLLRSVAQRLRACIRASDTVSRSGGDEFILLVLGENKMDSTATVAEKILSSMAEPQVIEGHELNITTSIGISVYPADAMDAEALIRKADTAMYEAKQQGGNSYRFYNSDMNDHRAGERAGHTD